MLSATATETVRATLPAVGSAIEDITALFYDRLFYAHPELLRDLFNRGNQANGTQRQALAGSIAAFAGFLLEHPEQRPDLLLSRIAHKHASLGIRPEQYQVVHTHLFAAIAEVLGEAVTPEVAAAWDEVYWLMANALIAIEAGLYRQAGLPEGEVWRSYRVVGREEETGDVAVFTVAPVDGSPAPASEPGQYLSVQVELANGARQIRQYSIVGSRAGTLSFAVKRIPAGTGDVAHSADGSPAGEVSGHLHAEVLEGAELTAGTPFGPVVLDRESDRPVLLASAGIGITPMVGMLEHLAEQGSDRRVAVLHADRSPAAHAFRGRVDDLVGKLPQATLDLWYEQPDQGDEHRDGQAAVHPGYLDLTAVTVPDQAVAYLCGPVPFLTSARSQLLAAGVPAESVHYEVFGPDLGL
ncbi:globin domain-containing protein [Streptacidiphilus carbonis]|uniref:globin domain-containing protein n=1 Tax=Streptacidiphilus carbonis TaxID=105422 RepID=UPI0005AB0EC8|nr:globin domain-containing protein [Streptacidiphilus carbonis]